MSCNTDYDICISQNSTYTLTLQLLTSGTTDPVNISNWEFSASLKPKIRSPDVTARFTCSVVSEPSATIKMVLSSDQTRELTRAKYVYDLIASVSGNDPQETVRLLEGDALVDLGVTRGS